MTDTQSRSSVSFFLLLPMHPLPLLCSLPSFSSSLHPLPPPSSSSPPSLPPSSPPEEETKVAADMVDYQKVCHLTRSPLSDMVAPAHAGELCLWGDEGTYDHVEIEYGQQVRLKTRGNSPFIGEQLPLFLLLWGKPSLAVISPSSPSALSSRRLPHSTGLSSEAEVC